MKIFDLSHKINNETMVFPNDPAIELRQTNNFINDDFNMFTLKTNMHVGTHVEVSKHMSLDVEFIKDYKLDNFIGRAVVLNFKDKVLIDWDESFNAIINTNDIIIIFTNHSKSFNDNNYYSNHPVLTTSFVDKLIEKKIKLIAIDFPSPDYKPYELHKKLFSNNINIVENLTNVESIINYSNIMFFAAPIKLEAEASLTRAFAICFD